MISENLHSNTEEFSFRPDSDSEVMKILLKLTPKSPPESIIYLQRLLNHVPAQYKVQLQTLLILLFVSVSFRLV